MKKVKTVAFNMLDPLDRRLYNHMERQMYFSTHMKRLIQRDVEQGKRFVLKVVLELNLIPTSKINKAELA